MLRFRSKSTDLVSPVLRILFLHEFSNLLSEDSQIGVRSKFWKWYTTLFSAIGCGGASLRKDHQQFIWRGDVSQDRRKSQNCYCLPKISCASKCRSRLAKPRIFKPLSYRSQSSLSYMMRYARSTLATAAYLWSLCSSEMFLPRKSSRMSSRVLRSDETLGMRKVRKPEEPTVS